MKGYIALMLWIVVFFWLFLALLNLKNDLNFTKEELKQVKASATYYRSRFENCKSQLGVFYRDPCLDNPELEICKGDKYDGKKILSD